MIGDERCKNKRPIKVEFDLLLLGDDLRQKRNMESAIDLDRFLKYSQLNEREMEILQCRTIGMNLREISVRFNFSESRASQLLARIKKEVYLWYSKEKNINFKLVTYQCPSCNGEVIVSDKVMDFECDFCSADIRIVDNIPILAVAEESDDVYF
jgi:DNA-binding CsgD family transcriptional regulator